MGEFNRVFTVKMKEDLSNVMLLMFKVQAFSIFAGRPYSEDRFHLLLLLFASSNSLMRFPSSPSSSLDSLLLLSRGATTSIIPLLH